MPPYGALGARWPRPAKPCIMLVTLSAALHKYGDAPRAGIDRRPDAVFVEVSTERPERSRKGRTWTSLATTERLLLLC
jgi:hypothetical protein